MGWGVGHGVRSLFVELRSHKPQSNYAWILQLLSSHTITRESAHRNKRCCVTRGSTFMPQLRSDTAKKSSQNYRKTKTHNKKTLVPVNQDNHYTILIMPRLLEVFFFPKEQNRQWGVHWFLMTKRSPASSPQRQAPHHSAPHILWEPTFRFLLTDVHIHEQ